MRRDTCGSRACTAISSARNPRSSACLCRDGDGQRSVFLEADLGCVWNWDLRQTTIFVLLLAVLDMSLVYIAALRHCVKAKEVHHIVAVGKMQDGVFSSDKLLIKCPSKYEKQK